jgi:hypothetical protein
VFFSLESAMGTYSAFCALSTKAVKEARGDGKQPAWGAGDGGESWGLNKGNEAAQRKRQREVESLDSERQPLKRKTTHGTNSASNGTRTPVGFAPSTSNGSRPQSGSYVYVESDHGIDRGDIADNGPSFVGVATSTQPRENGYRLKDTEEEPLFLPETSQSVDWQMEPPASQVLRDAGLQDFERMSQVELRAMLEDDGEEMGDIAGGIGDAGGVGDDIEMREEVAGRRGSAHYAPTQRSRQDDFRPLFDD